MAARRGRGSEGTSGGARGDNTRRSRTSSGDQLSQVQHAQEALMAQAQVQQALLYHSFAAQAAQAYVWNGGAAGSSASAPPLGMMPPSMMPGVPMMMHPSIMIPPGMTPMQTGPGFGAAPGQKMFSRSSGSALTPRGPKPTRDPGEESNSDEEGEDGTVRKTTTLMIRNMPQNITRKMLLDLLDHSGLAAGYDFVYLPMDFGTQASFGYALINFTSQELADRFRGSFDGFQAWPVDSERQAEVARVKDNGHKGLKANIDRYRNSPVMHSMVPDEFKPCLFADGRRVAFLRPTAKIKAPSKVPPKIRRQWMQQGRRRAGPDALPDPAAGQPRTVSLATAPPAEKSPPRPADEPVSIALELGAERARVDSDLSEHANDYSQRIAVPAGLRTPSDYGAYGAAGAGVTGAGASGRSRLASADALAQPEFWPRTPSDWNDPGLGAAGYVAGAVRAPQPGSGDAAGGPGAPTKAQELEARNSLLEDRIAELEAKVLALAQGRS